MNISIFHTPPKTAVVFYSYTQNSLEIWRVSERGIEGYSKQNISAEQITEGVISLRNSMALTALRRSRLPRLNAEQETSSVAVTPSPLRESAIANLTQILLPGLIAAALSEVEHLNCSTRVRNWDGSLRDSQTVWR